jgi:hypothetical protein
MSREKSSKKRGSSENDKIAAIILVNKIGHLQTENKR